MAVFRQSTSRADDPQLHTHVVISAKVQTAEGRWLALDALTLKKHQQAFGYLYQSMLRAEVTSRFGMVFDPIVNGQAEIAGLGDGLLEQFSKRAGEIGVEMGDKLADFHTRQGREPTSFEYAAMEREAAVDTRKRKTGLGVTDLRTRWHLEDLSLGADPATVVESAVDSVLAECVDLDPTDTAAHRRSDGRSVWIEPIAKQSTSEHVLAQEEHIITFALDAQTPEASPSATIVEGRLDDAQRTAASAVAGHDRLVVVVGPAGAGKTAMLEAAVADLHDQRRVVVGLAPTARAAPVAAPRAHQHGQCGGGFPLVGEARSSR